MFWLGIASCIVCYVAWKYFQDENPVDSVPGPTKWPIMGNNMFKLARMPQGKFFLMMREYVKMYGDRFVIKFFNRRVLNVYTAQDAEIVLSHSRNITKSGHYNALKPWLGTGLLISTGSKWHKRRKILTPTFHFNILKNFAAVIEDRSCDIVQQLKQTNGEMVDLAPFVKDFTLYTICETAMGIRLDLDKSKAALEYLEAVGNIGPVILRRALNPWHQFDFVYNRLPEGKLYDKYLKTITYFADNVIIERKQRRLKEIEEHTSTEDAGEKRRLAFLDMLLDAENKDEIDLEGIREEVNTFMFEGHDTTANAIIFALKLMADQPEVQEKVREEYHRITGGSDRALAMSEFAELKYLEAVIKETLRLFPSVPFIGRTITEDFTLDDLLVKAGTEVAVRIFELHRRPDVFPDPDSFKPERFLAPEYRPYSYVPFSAGPRNCIGQRFAMQEMKCVLSKICDNFTLVPDSLGTPSLMADMVLRHIEPIHVKFVPRNNM